MMHRHFLEGQDAYAQGLDCDPPYMESTEPYRSWVAGWHDAWYAASEYTK